ncbi:histidine kinase [Methylocucumis oryzae]|uniref:Histidine kinase n=2 Tax=Methylocucumis oryzae TaxID=1632867 RepID=A0A0F3IFZ6_9GAMM|nr:histidine kinase [Methylocucumis oryzae]
MDNLIKNLSFNLLLIRQQQTDATMSAQIVGVNASAASLLGYTEEELINQPLARILPHHELSIWPAALAKRNQADACFGATVLTKQQQHFQAILSVSDLPGQVGEHSDLVLLLQPLRPDNDFLVMRHVVEQSASAVMITDNKGSIAYVNPKFCAMTGYSADELLGQKPSKLQSGEMSKSYYQAMWDTLLNTGECQGEILNKHKNGSVYWVHESVSAIKNSAGEISHFLAIEEDITHRKAVESALSESEERFRQMAELSGEWLWEQDPQGYYLYSSTAVNQILGLSEEQILGKHYTQLLTFQDKATKSTVSSSQQPFHALLNHYRHKDGHQVITESTGLPIINADGKLLKWRGVDRDISARVQFEQALIESEKRTRLIIESSINAIVIMDSYGIISEWNQQAEIMFGWSAKEAIGQRLDELIIPSRYHEAHRQGMRHFLETGEGPILNRQIEHTAKRRDGSEFPVELSVSPLKLGNAYIFSSFIHDISNRKAAEQQIRQAQVDLAIAQSEIHIAQKIQTSLLPSAPLKSERFEITGMCLPADKVGGDYYDYFYQDQRHKLNIVIADVSGHSIGPALFMAETRSALRVQANTNTSPASAISALNNFLFADLDKADYFITLFYLQVDLLQNCLIYANAGHPPPLIFNRHTMKIKELDADGLVMGIQKNVDFEENTLPLTAGDVILFYTDGLTETENAEGEFFGLERVKQVVKNHVLESPQSIIDTLYSTLRNFCGRQRFADDITVMVFEWR